MASSIENLFSAMKEERKRSRPDEDDDFVVVQQINSQWPKLFEINFLSSETRLTQSSSNSTSDDDLIFYVTKKLDNESYHPSRLVEAYRHHDEKRRPKLGSPEYDWEETMNLNLVLHQFEYTVTTAICIKTSSRHLQIIKRLSTKVYASPSQRSMENKGTEERITYPNIYFTVDNYEDAFCDMLVNEGQMVCVELVGTNPLLKEKKVLFLGSIKYEALRRVYDTRASTSTRVAQRVTLGIYNKRRVEFVRMRGPNGKGHAEMAVSRPRSAQSGMNTPDTTPSTPITNKPDEENWSQRQTSNDNSPTQWISALSRSNAISSNVGTPEVESTDIRQELADGTGGFIGRTFNQAINWVRGSSFRLNQGDQSVPLQTCLTYLTLPCQVIVADILESKSVPILTVQ